MPRLSVLLLLSAWCATAAPPIEQGSLALHSPSQAHFKFSGFIGERVNADVENWLLRAPQANPGMIEMFRNRDRTPAPQLVPWAGEFVGKYLVSAILALHMSEDPRLRLQVSNVISAFIATQAEDGYLGPFPRQDRLLKNWDLWGHYHALCALVLWHQQTGDPAALSAAQKACDLICRIYLDSGRRVLQAGDPEMNMSILTGMVMMYRVTGEQRYLRMAQEVETDWLQAGDYLRAGLDGREYFQCPRPRWESLHDLQGLLELWRITGAAKYREAFIHHWRSIARWDQRNTGGFSSGEQATGNPYAPSAIETCCTVAWTALTLDYLRLTGDLEAADMLELATLNGGVGAQHPSGRWWTYNTPMDGVREASAHTIVFQARAGTPELNCCSVNGPRILGLLAEWAVMSDTNSVTVNSYLPGEIDLTESGHHLRLVLHRDYPVVNSQHLSIITDQESEWTLRLRIPSWSSLTTLQASFLKAPRQLNPGTYAEIHRHWKTGDTITLQFNFDLRAVAGANEAAGKVSLYRGPLLLAYDPAFNDFDENAIPKVDLADLKKARLQTIGRSDGESAQGHQQASPFLGPFYPWIEVDLPAEGGRHLRLVDFASAGSSGTRYRSWLEPREALPPPALTQYPRDGERIRPGRAELQWRAPGKEWKPTCRVQISSDPKFKSMLLQTNVAEGNRIQVELPKPDSIDSAERWWRVLTLNTNGLTIPEVPPARFVLAEDAPPQKLPHRLVLGPNAELIRHALDSTSKPKFGEMLPCAYDFRPNQGFQVNGHDQMVRYSIPSWPEEDFTVALRFRVDAMPRGRLGQVFSAWTSNMDDPLRLVIDSDKLSARIESSSAFATPGIPLEAGQWHRAAAVKHAEVLTCFVDGKAIGSCRVPGWITTSAVDCALGGNPHFAGNEYLAATFADFGFWAVALSQEQLEELAKQK